MQTRFTPDQLRDPAAASSESILRACVHCGFCTATCPTYVLLGDELDSPRGRIYLIKDMLENDRPASPQVVKHIDRCLSCLACMTTCPSGVHYGHLVDHARAHIERTYRRPLGDRLMRKLLALVLPRPRLFRTALLGATVARPLARALPAKLRPLLALAPASVPKPSPLDRPQVHAAEGPRRARVALLTGCAQRVIAPSINAATVRLLTRHGVEVVIARGAGCCGALTHHLGKEAAAKAHARALIDAWTREIEGGGLNAVVVNTSGCGTVIKDYGFMLEHEPAYAVKAARVAAMTRDVTEFMSEIGLMPSAVDTDLVVAYHAACSLQHGQKVRDTPKKLLTQAGFTVKEPADAHLCCGSAGTYNLLQPEIAGQLRDRKVATIEATAPDVIAAGNVGCLTQIGGGTRTPVAHTVELLDWATGGPRPAALADRRKVGQPA